LTIFGTTSEPKNRKYNLWISVNNGASASKKILADRAAQADQSFTWSTPTFLFSFFSRAIWKKCHF